MNLGGTGLAWQYWNNKASAADLLTHLQHCEAGFVAALRQRTDLAAYATKLAQYATRFEAWENGCVISVVAVYCNDTQTRQAYISNVSTLPAWQGQGIAKTLLNYACAHAHNSGMTQVQLEVAANNQTALRLYQQQGFAVTGQSTDTWHTLCLTLP